MKKDKQILLAHGSGGILSRELVRDLFLKYLVSPRLASLEDAAYLSLGKTSCLFTTDSFVVKPLFFPGGDIGKLAVCGTLNDLCVMASRPLYLSLGCIIEEGFLVSDLERIVVSLSRQAKEAGVAVVTGDLKVVERGACDGIFLNTSGIGIPVGRYRPSAARVRPGDSIIISGTIAEHGLAVFMAREPLGFRSRVKSDCAALSGLLLSPLEDGLPVNFMRDPTRGGLAGLLHELAVASQQGVLIYEERLPLRPEVEAALEVLGMDPLFMANEGKAVLAVPSQVTGRWLERLRSHPLGRRAAVIGEITRDFPSQVILRTRAGGQRIVHMPYADPLPRIC